MARPLLFTRLVLWTSALTFLGFGIAFAVAPTEMTAVVEIEAATPMARADIRAMYGGLEIGAGLAMALCACSKRQVVAGVVLATLMLAAMASMRGLGIYCDEQQPLLTYILFASEVLGVVAGVLALLRERGR